MNRQDAEIIDRLKDTVREMESYIREEYCTDYEDFLENDILKRAVAMCMINIDQMVSGFSEDFMKENQHIMYYRFATIRTIAERNYKSLDFFVLWNIVTKEMTAFLNEILIAAGMDKTSNRLGQPVLRTPEYTSLSEQVKTEAAPEKPEVQKPPFAMNELYKRQAYTQMMQMNMTKEQATAETKKDVSGILDILENEKKSRGL